MFDNVYFCIKNFDTIHTSFFSGIYVFTSYFMFFVYNANFVNEM